MSESIRLAAGELCIDFVRETDRYRHEVLVFAGKEPLRLLGSVEGTADDDWPASPPLQDLHVEHRGANSRVALLIGRAGRSHWSLSVEADASRGMLLFDAACRTPATDDCLRSSYQLLANSAPAVFPVGNTIPLTSDCRLQIVDGRIHLDPDGHSFKVAPRAPDAR
ncbi:MAG TPA: hypothetical protein VFI31_30625, partial [Pirellulales bacterium]|nr:hypothetical protein [Pirellulales bacterium]